MFGKIIKNKVTVEEFNKMREYFRDKENLADKNVGLWTVHYLSDEIQKSEHKNKYFFAIDLSELSNDDDLNTGFVILNTAYQLEKVIECISTNLANTKIYGLLPGGREQALEIVSVIMDDFKKIPPVNIGIVALVISEEDKKISLSHPGEVGKKRARIFDTADNMLEALLKKNEYFIDP